MKKLTVLFTLAAGPALAAGGAPFASLYNTNTVVLIAFLLFLGVLIWVKVPKILSTQLDGRADGIRQELDDAKALREEAQTLLASYERKQKEVQEQSERIIATAKTEAAAAAEQAKSDLAASIERRLAAAEEQIASAEASAIKEVRDRAIAVAVAAAGDVIAKKVTAAEGNALIEDAIEDVAAKLH